MSLAYETSEETVSPFRYMVERNGVKPLSASLGTLPFFVN